MQEPDFDRPGTDRLATGQAPADAPASETKAGIGGELESRPERRWRSLVFQASLLAALVLFALLAYLASTTAYFPIDLAITRFVQSFNSPWVEALMRAVSWPGYSPQVILIVISISSLVFVLGLRWEAAVSGLSGGIVLALNSLAKTIVERPRPSADVVQVFRELLGFSFPSGHVMFYLTFFGFHWFLAYSLLQPSWKRTLLLWLLGGLVVMVGPSRIFLGSHWASDVLGGFLLGGSVLAGTVLVYLRGKQNM
jgi:undecaprenyl-diphosphatase